MERLWPLYIEPILRALEPGRVMQVGAGDGRASARLLDYCRSAGARADIIEPRPQPGLEDVLAPFAEVHDFHRLLPLKAIGMAEPPELVLLDGEPNWWTVTGALNLLRRLAAEQGRSFPGVLVHHTGWPYSRRDMYPNPDAVEERQPYAYQGVAPGEPGLVPDGLNGRFAHALREGGPHNGVLTAVEDFIAAAPFEVRFWSLPFFNGLGVLVPQARLTPALQGVIEGFFAPDSLMQAAKALEAEGVLTQVELALAQDRLERRTAALKRARDLLAKAGGV